MRPFITFLFSCAFQLAHAQIPPFVAEDFGEDEQGYYFMTPFYFQGASNDHSEVVMLDGRGNVVFHQEVPYGSNFRVWPDGRMSYAARGKHILLDSDFLLVDSVSCANGVTNDLHELRILDNGNYLLLGIENVTMDLSAYSFFQNGNASGSDTATVESVVIQELSADQDLLWEWHAADHFNFLDGDTTRFNNPNVVDWTHSNALEMDTDGNVLLSSRHFNEITKISRTADTIIWRLGGVRNDFDFGNDPGFFLQHDIRRLPNGNITLFDNSKANEHPGRAVEYALNEIDHTATPIWSRAFGPGTYSRAMGSAQRLSNGNTLVGWGALTPDNAMFTIYGPDSSLVSQLYFPDTLVTYRAYFFDDLPFTIDRPQIICTQVGNSYELSALPNGTNYLWSTGETSQVITVGQDDTVHVEVPIGSGGFLRSLPFVPNSDCSQVGIHDLDDGSPMVVYPNPAGDFVTIRATNTGSSHSIELMDAMGHVLRSKRTTEQETTMDLATLPNGLYFVRLNDSVRPFVKSD